VANGNLAVSQLGAAFMLDNMFPTATGVLMRRGCQNHTTLVASPLRSMFTYVSGNLKKLFAANDTAIFDVTIAGSTTNVSSATSGAWITAQYQSTDGTTYLRGVNGADTPFVYNGSAFTTTLALTFPGGSSVTPSQLSYTWVYKNRFFFIQKESLDVWYLPVGQIGGALVNFSLGGAFKLGGSLVMGATWSRDTGSGMNAMCAFFSSEGEVAIYQGEDPAALATWAQVGVFRVGRPLGPKAIMDAGGDLVVATDVGFVPLSKALDTDIAILGNAALSESIVDLWNDEAFNRSGGNWNVAFWSKRQLVAVALPTVNDRSAKWLVANARTRAWCTYSNWDATCIAVHDDRLFFGTADGKVFEANVSGVDDGKPYTATCLPMFDNMGVAGLKTVQFARPVFRGPYPINAKTTMQMDFAVNIPAAPSSNPVQGSSLWGDAEWGIDEWGSSDTAKLVFQQWVSTFGDGEVFSPCIQVTNGSLGPSDGEMIRIDVAFTQGEIVT
jgi:hypothetical protein